MTKTFDTINPYTQEKIASYQALSTNALNDKLIQAEKAYSHWQKTSFTERGALFMKAAALLKARKETYGQLISQEMGKPVTQARAEVEKCSWVCEYYAENAEKILTDEILQADGVENFVSFSPIGAVFAIMPWNFPFWQVFRYAAPTLMAGNVTLLKHAPNCFGSAEKIQEVFTDAGFPAGVFQNLIVDIDQTEQIISHPLVQAVTLTGSERAGSSVAALAGKYLKKTVLELGGSDPFIVFEDADLDKAAEIALMARMQNSGQSCIASKRFIVMEAVAEQFKKLFKAKIAAMKAGDPLDDATQIGPLARIDLAEGLKSQLDGSLAKGAHLEIGGKQDGAAFAPTLLSGVVPGMPAFDEELFGPVAAFITVTTEEEAIQLANQSDYGLGASVWTKDLERGKRVARQINSGCVFVNSMVKSDPRLPFGGIKKSGYGRELSHYGLKEFVNIKTISVHA